MLMETGLLAILCFSFASQGFAQQANNNTSETAFDLVRISRDIANDIIRGEYIEANRKIVQFGLPLSSIEDIVDTVYDKNISNLELLRNLSDASNDIPTSYAAMTVLWHEMTANGDMDLFDMITMYQQFFNKVTNQQHVTNELKTKLVTAYITMRNDIMTIAAATLKAAILDRNSTRNSKIQWVAESLKAIDELIVDDTMRKVVGELFSEISVEELIRALSSFKRVSQSLTVLVTISDHLSATNNFNDIAAMQLADELSRLQKTTPYKTISESKKNEVERMINQLPVSIRNLYLSTKLCIRNTDYSEYLTSPNDYFKSDDDRRFVYTSSNKNYSQTHWYKKKYVDKKFSFEFFSDFNRYEYLYASETKRCSGLCRLVMTWIPGGGLEEKSVWSVEPIDGKMFLRNLHYNELLCLTDERPFANSRYVLTQKSEENYDSSRCRWIFESC